MLTVPLHEGVSIVNSFIVWCLVGGRDENDQKRLIGGQITFVFTFFSRKRNRYDIVGNEYGADIPVISKTIVVDRKIHR
jgi:hypothetical protein